MFFLFFKRIEGERIEELLAKHVAKSRNFSDKDVTAAMSDVAVVSAVSALRRRPPSGKKNVVAEGNKRDGGRRAVSLRRSDISENRGFQMTPG